MATYTVFIVTRNADHHYPVLMANNGKAMLNEPVTRANKLVTSWQRFAREMWLHNVPVERITEKAFKAKFPQFARNAGKKRITKKVTNPVK
jgi:hypothetical protein